MPTIKSHPDKPKRSIQALMRRKGLATWIVTHFDVRIHRLISLDLGYVTKEMVGHRLIRERDKGGVYIVRWDQQPTWKDYPGAKSDEA